MKVIKAEKKQKLSEDLLDFYCGGLSYSRFRELLRKKDIKVNGKRVNSDVTLSCGDEIICYYDGEAVKPYSELFRDENVLAVDKRKGISSEALYERLLADYGEVFFCHRLDTNTDGVMLFALNEKAYLSLVDGFKARRFEKYYLAEVYGKLKKKEATIEAYLVKDGSKSLVKIYDAPRKDSKKIITAYKVVEERESSSVLSVRLLTGRTHQIRAHLAHEGHFILGDGKYGVEKINRELKAKELRLTSYKTVLRFNCGDYLDYLDGFTIKSGVFFK